MVAWDSACCSSKSRQDTLASAVARRLQEHGFHSTTPREAFPLRVVIAPDKFKGCLSASQVARAIAQGIGCVDSCSEIDACPIADGGEGTVAALVAATGGRLLHRRVTGPLPEMKVDAAFGMLGDGRTAVIEMAAASGLALLLPQDRNPLRTTTFGTGELLAAAVELGATHIILGIGGSATVDGGVGCAQACGHTIVMEDGEPVSITEPLVGADVARVVMVKRHRGEKTDRVKITVASDVTNPLFGENGAAVVFGPQKGATPEQVQILDAALRQLAARNGKTDLASTPGAGAAGGLGFGMLAFFGAELRSGIDIVLEAIRLRDRLRGADLCFTGEGRLDTQSLGGKAIIGVSRICKEAGVPCIALGGSVDRRIEASLVEGLTAWFSICDGPMTLDAALGDAEALLARCASNVFRLWCSAK
jgi:glycerate kinase